MLQFIPVLLASLLFTIAQAKYSDPGAMALYSCSYFSFLFDYTPITKDTYWEINCHYEPAFQTIAICLNQFDDGSYAERGFHALQESCSKYGSLSNLTQDYFEDQAKNGSQYLIQADSFNATADILHNPVQLNLTFVDLYYKSYVQFYWNFDFSQDTVAIVLHVYVVGILLMFVLVNLMKQFGLITKFKGNRVINAFRRYISLPALVGRKHTEAAGFWKVFTTLLPTRLDSFIIGGYLVAYIVMMSVHYNVAHDVIFLNKTEARIRYFADRTGIIAFVQLPLLFLFGGRNNILSFCTGLNFSSFIVYHKWIARIMVFNAIMHSAAWTWLERDYLPEMFADTYWKWGVVATIVCSLMVLFSFHCVRNTMYEFFLYAHIILGCLFVVGIWYHCIELGWMQWVYASIAIWAFDRLIRLVRMAYYGFPKATIQVVGEETMKVSFPKPSRWKSNPANHIFLYFGDKLRFFQSHPFTPVIYDDKIVVYIKVKKGITKKIYEQAAKTANGQITMRVGVEGPYGHSSPLHKYDRALLVAGGNGIPGPFDHAFKLVTDKNPTIAGQKVKLVWISQSFHTIKSFLPELVLLKEKCPQNKDLEVQIYLTRETPIPMYVSEDDFKDTVNKEKESVSDSFSLLEIDNVSVDNIKDFVHFSFGRPDLKSIIVDEFTEAEDCSVGIVTCGPTKMVDEVRELVAHNLNKCKGRVDLFEELELW
ncbi:hypothetical protein LJB42_001056 [Komagataella kurtzmanii]|nr:hypothetical protein LJB42_001056 [Komagataella kurtzmanii]